jgi:hypothetical protein
MIPGIGFRTASDVLLEASTMLVEPIFQTTLTEAVSSTGSQTVTVGSVLDPSNSELAIYNGAQVVIDTGTNAEIVTITAFVQSPASITGVFSKTHASGVPATAACWPLQQATDPIYTQSEMLGYLSRAQNEFLEQVPIYFAQFYQEAPTGSMIQPTPPTAIEIERIASSNLAIPALSLVRSGSVVTATFIAPHGLVVGSTFWIQPAGTFLPSMMYFDPSFAGVFQVASVVSPTVLTYNQTAPDAYTDAGMLTYYYRLFEITQTEMSALYPGWQSVPSVPNAYAEDRTGLYGFILNGIPPFNIPLNILASVRDSDTLSLLDGFLLPDLLIPYLRWRVLSYALDKSGVFMDKQRAEYAYSRFQRGILAVRRLMDGLTNAR